MAATLYAMPRGELRRELIACLRWSRDKRRSKTRAPDGRGHIAEMQSIHLRPPEVADTRPKKSLGFRSPVEVYSELLLNMELAKTATKH